MNKILILEDNNSKIIELMYRYDGLFDKAEIVIVRTVEAARNYCKSNLMPMTFFVDYDLGQLETGLDFLQWLLPEYRQLAGEIYIISANPSSSVEMSKFCWKHGISAKQMY